MNFLGACLCTFEVKPSRRLFLPALATMPTAAKTISPATSRAWSLVLYGVILLKLTAYLYFKFGINTLELPGTSE